MKNGAKRVSLGWCVSALGLVLGCSTEETDARNATAHTAADVPPTAGGVVTSADGGAAPPTAPTAADGGVVDAGPVLGPGFTIYPLGGGAIAAPPGADVPLTVRIAYVGPALSDEHPVFVHLVSDARPDWFDAQVYPMAGPASSAWTAGASFTGTLQLPKDAKGHYTLMAGVHHDMPGAQSPNLRMTPADPAVVERFGAGVIGYRYAIGSVDVGAAPSTATPPPAPATPNPSPAWVDTIVADMVQPSDATAVARGGGSMQVYASQAAIGASGGNFDSIAGICSGVCDHFADHVAGAISWTWIWAGAQNQSAHTRVLARHARGYYLSKSTGHWVAAFDARPSGAAEAVDESTGNHSQGNPDTQVAIDAFTTALQPDAFYKYELWGAANVGHAAFTDARAWFFATELSVAPDSSGIDDRASSEFLVKVGADFFTGESVPATDIPGAGGRYIDIATGQIVAGVCDTCYPYVAMDGFGGRYRRIPKDGSWITVTAISMAGAYAGAYLPPPWGNYSTPSPWGAPPYVLTETEVRANPPPQ